MGETRSHPIIVYTRLLPRNAHCENPWSSETQKNFKSEIEVEPATMSDTVPAAMFPFATLLLLPRRVGVATDQDNSINFVYRL